MSRLEFHYKSKHQRTEFLRRDMSLFNYLIPSSPLPFVIFYLISLINRFKRSFNFYNFHVWFLFLNVWFHSSLVLIILDRKTYVEERIKSIVLDKNFTSLILKLSNLLNRYIGRPFYILVQKTDQYKLEFRDFNILMFWKGVLGIYLGSSRPCLVVSGHSRWRLYTVPTHDPFFVESFWSLSVPFNGLISRRKFRRVLPRENRRCYT